MASNHLFNRRVWRSASFAFNLQLWERSTAEALSTVLNPADVTTLSEVNLSQSLLTTVNY